MFCSDELAVEILLYLFQNSQQLSQSLLNAHTYNFIFAAVLLELFLERKVLLYAFSKALKRDISAFRYGRPALGKLCNLEVRQLRKYFKKFFEEGSKVPELAVAFCPFQAVVQSLRQLVDGVIIGLNLSADALVKMGAFSRILYALLVPGNFQVFLVDHEETKLLGKRNRRT